MGIAIEQTLELETEEGELHTMSHQLRDHLIPGNQIDQGDEGHTEQMAPKPANQPASGGVVTNHLRHTEERRFQRGRAAGHHGGHGMSE